MPSPPPLVVERECGCQERQKGAGAAQAHARPGRNNCIDTTDAGSSTDGATQHLVVDSSFGVEAARCASCGRPLVSPYAACEPCTGIEGAEPWHRPDGHHHQRTVVRTLRTAVLPGRGDVYQAVTDDLTAVAVVSAVVAGSVAVAAASLPFATVDGVTRSLSDDPSAGFTLVLVGLVTLGALFVARLPSGWGIGFLAAAASGIPLIHLRAAAAVLGDGSHEVFWEVGSVLATFASVVAVAPLLCALTGLRTGRRVTRLPIWATPLGLAAVVVLGAWRRQAIIDSAGGLGPVARLALSSVVAGELVMLTLASAARSRLGAGIFVGAAVLPTAYLVGDAAESQVAIDLVEPTELASSAVLLGAVGIVMTVLARRRPLPG